MRQEYLDYGTIHGELVEFGVIDGAIAEIGLAIAELVRDADRRQLNYVVSYAPRRDRRLTVDILHYRAKPPKFTADCFKLPKAVASQLFIMKNFPPKGYTLRFVSAHEVFETTPDL